jgi:hypothetical protein
MMNMLATDPALITIDLHEYCITLEHWLISLLDVVSGFTVAVATATTLMKSCSALSRRASFFRSSPQLL